MIWLKLYENSYFEDGKDYLLFNKHNNQIELYSFNKYSDVIQIISNENASFNIKEATYYFSLFCKVKPPELKSYGL